MGWLSVLATEVFVIINYAELCASMVSVIVQELQVFLLLGIPLFFPHNVEVYMKDSLVTIFQVHVHTQV